MGQITLYQDTSTDSTIVSNSFIDEYMKDANDAQIKVYLYLLRMINSNLPTSISDIADKFNHTEKDVIRALTYWEKQNLLRLNYDAKGLICGLHINNIPTSSSDTQEAQIVPMPQFLPDPEEEPAQPLTSDHHSATKIPHPSEKLTYSLEDVAAFKKDALTSQIIFITESYLGRTLSAMDIRTLLFIHKELHFSIELMDYLIEYCVGKGKREIRYIEKVATNWATEGISTVHLAKNRSTRYDKFVYTVMKALGLKNDPTELEAEFIQRWSKQYGFSQELILAACEKTVLATSSRRFEYAEGILSKWHKSGIYTIEDVKKAEDEFYKNKKSHSTNKKSAKPVNSFNSFSQQREYDFEELNEELFLN